MLFYFTVSYIPTYLSIDLIIKTKHLFTFTFTLQSFLSDLEVMIVQTSDLLRHIGAALFSVCSPVGNVLLLTRLGYVLFQYQFYLLTSRLGRTQVSDGSYTIHDLISKLIPHSTVICLFPNKTL